MEMMVGNLPGIRMAQGVDTINHVLFADNSPFLGGSSKNIAKAFKKVIHSYYPVSCGKVNSNKISIYGWNVEQMALSQIARMLGMQGFDKWGIFKYLGIPISSGVYKENHWQEVDNKIKAKLSD